MFDLKPVLIDGGDALVNRLIFQGEHNFGRGTPWRERHWYGYGSGFSENLRYLAQWKLEAGIDQAETSSAEIENGIDGSFSFTGRRAKDARSSGSGGTAA